MESTLFKNTSRGRTSGILKGPITMVYAVGGIAIILLDKYLMPRIKTNKIIKLIISFIIYSVVLGLIEYICGYLCNILFGIDMWNYKSKKYHIGKYTCLEYIPIWGLIAIIIKIIPREFTYFISFIFALDFLITILTK